MREPFDYTSPLWRAVAKRAIARDGHRCVVSRLLGGRCRGTLHAHHLIPVAEGGPAYDLDGIVTVCAVHHPQLEAVRRAVLARRERNGPPRCPHSHRTAEARALCERRLARQRYQQAA